MERKREEKKKKSRFGIMEFLFGTLVFVGLETICVWIMFGKFLCDVWNSCLEFMFGLLVWNYHKYLFFLSCVGKILL